MPSPCFYPSLSVSFSPSFTLSGGIFLALLHSFLLHCQAAAAVSTLLPLSAHNLVLLATPPLSHTLHMAVRMSCMRVWVLGTHTSCLPELYRHSYICVCTRINPWSTAYKLDVYSATLRENKRKWSNSISCQDFCLLQFESQYNTPSFVLSRAK